MVDAFADRVLQHLEPVQAFLLEMFDADPGNVLVNTLFHEFFFRYLFELLGFDLHELASLLAIGGEAPIGIEYQRLTLLIQKAVS